MSDPFSQLLRDIAEAPLIVEKATRELPPLAAEIERLKAQLDLIVREYDATLADESVKIPTRLHLAIEAART